MKRAQAALFGCLLLGFAGLTEPALAQTQPATKPAAAAKPAPAKPAAAKPSVAKPAATKPVAASAPGGAEGHQAMLMGTFGDWGAYVSQQGKSKVCYAMTQPKDRLPKGLNRDPAYLFIATRPAEGVRNEIAFVMGFATKEGSDAQAVAGSATAALVTKGSDAWLRNPAEEPRTVEAWKAATGKLLVKVQSKRGNSLTDEYSLSGLTGALDRVKKECP